MSMTAQEIFSTVVRHIRKQGKQALGPTGHCRYLAPDGSKCAVGCLIPEGHPAFAWDAKGGDGDTSLSGLFDAFPDLKELLPFEALLRSLQWSHDAPVEPGQDWPSAMEFEFARHARTFGLTIPEKE